MASLRFIHCADLHLDHPYQGVRQMPESIVSRLRKSTFLSFRRVIDTAINEQVDFIIIAGDLFDHEDRSLTAQLQFRDQMQRLQAHRIEAFVIHGNHDYLSGNPVVIQWPDNVHVFSGDAVEALPFYKNNDIAAWLHGFSYQQRAVKKRMIADYVPAEDDSFHIGLLHGNLDGQTEHDAYAPFTLNELLGKGYDYWALGHIHKRRVIHEQPTVVYPGCIQGLHKNETGEKGCTFVEMDNKETHLSFIPTADIIWDTQAIDIDDIETEEDFLSRCESVIEDRRSRTSGVLLSLTFTGVGPLHEWLQDDEHMAAIEAALQEGEEQRTDFVWLTSYKRQTMLHWNREQLRDEQHFIGDLLRLIDDEGIPEDVLNDLYKHRRYKTFLDLAMDKEDILMSAENVLLTALLQEEAGEDEN